MSSIHRDALDAARTLVAFDWNGTLLDDADRAMRSTCAALRHVGLDPIEQEDFENQFQLPLTRFFSELGVPDSAVETAVQVWNHHMQRDSAQPAAFAVDTLRWLREQNMITAVVTAASWGSLGVDLDTFDLSPYITFAAASVEDKLAVLTVLVERFGTVVYIGDTEYDMSCALGAGALPIGIPGGYGADDERLLAAGAITTIQALDRLPPLLSTLTESSEPRTAAVPDT